MELSPMLLEEVEFVPGCFDKYKNWMTQEKMNGIRALIHIKDSQIVGIRGRNGNPVLFMFPEFKNLPVSIDEGVLDAEIVVLKDGRSVYYGGVDQRRSAPTEKTLKEYPATIVVFDALKINGTTLLMKPYKTRYEIITANLRENDKLQIAKNYLDADEAWKKIVTENREGLVLKNPDAVYELGKRSPSYLKCKNYKQCSLVVEKVEANKTGTKVYGKTEINGAQIIVEAQVQNQAVMVGETKTIRYLDIYHNRLIQPVHSY
jgi:bifunctional non-homologous end joining protein LigD